MKVSSPIITLLSDFGSEDSYVAEVKGVLLSRHPRAALVDITHQVPSYHVEAGAFQLLRAYRYFPKGTWHMAVVDPGVGTERRCVYARTRDYHFVGPDNGLLLWAVRDCEKREKKKAALFRIPVGKESSVSFHGRDVFAPFVAGRISGARGKLSAVSILEGREFPETRREGRAIVGEIVAQDHFGNLVTSIPVDGIRKAEATVADRSVRLHQVANYQAIPEGELALVQGSHGFWEISCRSASAADRLQLKRRSKVTLTVAE